MDTVLLHCCCAPCSLSCIDPLLGGLHPAASCRGHRAGGTVVQPQHPPLEGVPGPAGLPAGIRPYHRHGGAGPGGLRPPGLCPPRGRRHRPPLRPLLRMPRRGRGQIRRLYQDHEGIVRAAERYAAQYGVEFLYRDFRPNFRPGNQRARELGFYMQKYCGCVFSEQDRYQKQIDRDRARFAEEAPRA